MLYGSHQAKVDGKGRVKIPADFRHQIQEQFDDSGEFFVTRVNADFARLYPIAAWQAINRTLEKQPVIKEAIKKFRRITTFYGRRAKADPQGRILLHPELRSAVGIKDDVLFMGESNYMGLWNLDKFKVSLKKDGLTGAEEENLAEFGI